MRVATLQQVLAFISAAPFIERGSSSQSRRHPLRQSVSAGQSQKNPLVGFIVAIARLVLSNVPERRRITTHEDAPRNADVSRRARGMDVLPGGARSMNP